MGKHLLLTLGFLGLSLAPRLAVATPDKDAVTGVVITFAKAWETGDLAAFEATQDGQAAVGPPQQHPG
jgi:hypothetical protein